MRTISLMAAAIIFVASGAVAFAEDAVDPAAVKSEDGKYLDKDAIGDHLEELMKSAKEEAEKEKKIPATW